MRKLYYKQKYKTLAGLIESHYVWSNEIETATHQSITSNQVLTYRDLYDEPVNAAPAIRTPTGNRVIQQQKKRRNINHFKKEVYNTLERGSHEQKHFAKKHGLK